MAQKKITRHNKLVRDGIPRKIRRNGEIPKTRTLLGLEKRHHLLIKLGEESKEALLAESSEKQMLELVDVAEVLDQLFRDRGVSWRVVRALQAQKRRQIGGFRLGTFLETTRKA